MVTFLGCNSGRTIYLDPDSDPPTADSKRWNKVWDYTPAPGQFIGDQRSGFQGVASPADACRYAEERLSEGLYVSLGGFGGYIIVGFDHSIENTGDYNFSVKGNQSASSSEPGIVWVSADDNGDGTPNDAWYELRGSETGKTKTRTAYSVTYSRPSAPGTDTPWTGSDGAEGVVFYRGDFHPQDYYYPEWIASDSYTLSGTLLENRVLLDPSTGFWSDGAFDWGYVDNSGSDAPPADLSVGSSEASEAGKVYFKISNAIRPDGTPAALPSINFIKVQTGVNANAGWLGEISTEVLDFRDENP